MYLQKSLHLSSVKYNVLVPASLAHLLFGGKLTVLGIVVDKSLYLSNDTWKNYQKVRKQLDVLSRFRKILSCSLGPVY